MERDGETFYKVVCLGPRGVPAELLERARKHWEVEGWLREDGLGGPGEPPIDVSMFHVPFDGAQRIYFFGHCIDPLDFRTLGPETRGAMFKGADHVVVVLTSSDRLAVFLDGIEIAFPEGGSPPTEIVVLNDARSRGAFASTTELPVTIISDDAGTWLDELARRVLRATGAPS